MLLHLRHEIFISIFTFSLNCGYYESLVGNLKASKYKILIDRGSSDEQLNEI